MLLTAGELSRLLNTDVTASKRQQRSWRSTAFPLVNMEPMTRIGPAYSASMRPVRRGTHGHG